MGPRQVTRPVQGSMLRLDAILSRAAALNPSVPAVICGDVSRTYAEVEDRARRLARGLAGLGVGHGDRVALWAPNCPEFIEMLFGVPLLGAIFAPLDHWWTETDTLAALAQIRPKVLVVGAAQALLLRTRQSDLHAVGVDHVLCLEEPPDGSSTCYLPLLTQSEPLRDSTAVSEGDAALILFTSGSTGRPKGAVHTHCGLLATAMIMNIEFGLRPGERTLHFLPLFSSCLEHMIPFTLAGATHVILPQFNASQVWQAITDYGVTHMNTVPTTLRRLLDRMPDVVPASLRTVSYASEPMPSKLAIELHERMPYADLIQIYGMIEHLCLTVQRPSEQMPKIGTVGRPMIGAELRLQPLDDASGDDGTGEIIARSPTLFAGYWQDAAATSQVVRDGWMRTGDIGRFDEDGYLRLVGRLKEVIKSGGVTVIPTEVETTLLSHDAVREAAVVGVPDERWGEAVHAFVVLHDGAVLAESELTAFCRARLAGYKAPKAVHFLSDLPRTGIGKIARREVRAQYLQSEAGKVPA